MSKLTQLVPPTVRRRGKLQLGDRCFRRPYVAPEKRLSWISAGVVWSEQHAGHGVRLDEDLFVSK